MISYIRGKIVDKTPTYVILEANNIGYYIKISLNTYEGLEKLEKSANNEVLLLTLLHIKEDAHTIYGFCNEHERYLFKQLITVNGIGYASANIALSYMSSQELEAAILAARTDLIKKIKGIGEKSANRIVLELKDKLNKTNKSETLSMYKDSNNQSVELAIGALITLGFSKTNVEKIINKISFKSLGNISVEALVKEALKHL